MRVLVTGACGFLGHHLVEHLLKTTEAEVIGLDRLSYASRGFDRLRDIAVFDDRRVLLLGADLAAPLPDGLRREVEGVDYVIHAAAETHVENSIRDPFPFIRANILGTHQLLWWARSQKRLRRVFLISTDEVYGPAPFGHPGYGPEDRFRPTNPYAATKAGAECLALSYAHSYGLPLTIVNTMNLFGERQHPEKFIPMTVRKVLAGERVAIHSDPTRTFSGTRFYLHCRTLATGISFLVDLERQGTDLPVKLHLSGEREVSNLGLARRIAETLGRELEYEMVDFHSSRPGHDLRYALRDDWIVSQGWLPPVTFDEALERTVRWYERNPAWLEPDGRPEPVQVEG